MAENLLYETKVSKQSNALLWLLSGIPAVAALGLAVASVFMFTTKDWLIGLFPLALSAVCGFTFYLLLKLLRGQPLNTNRLEVTKEGVQHRYSNDDTGELLERFIPFDEVTALYIARHAQPIKAGKHMTYYLHARMFVEFEEEGERKYVSFIDTSYSEFERLFYRFPVERLSVYAVRVNVFYVYDSLFGDIANHEKLQMVTEKDPLKLPYSICKTELFSPRTP